MNILSVIWDFMNGKKFNTGTIMVVAVYIFQHFGMDHDAGEAGTVLHIKLKEQFIQRDLSLLGIVKAVASETISPLAGSAIGAVA